MREGITQSHFRAGDDGCALWSVRVSSPPDLGTDPGESFVNAACNGELGKRTK